MLRMVHDDADPARGDAGATGSMASDRMVALARRCGQGLVIGASVNELRCRDTRTR
ncbi:hypothetical protein [Pseudonocardia bannensis]|nr:hypothetical protein [Pseudonocardia bannensis]